MEIYAFGFIASVLLGITFYNVWWSGVVFIPFAIYLINTLKKEIVEKKDIRRGESFWTVWN